MQVKKIHFAYVGTKRNILFKKWISIRGKNLIRIFLLLISNSNFKLWVFDSTHNLKNHKCDILLKINIP